MPCTTSSSWPPIWKPPSELLIGLLFLLAYSSPTLPPSTRQTTFSLYHGKQYLGVNFPLDANPVWGSSASTSVGVVYQRTPFGQTRDKRGSTPGWSGWSNPWPLFRPTRTLSPGPPWPDWENSNLHSKCHNWRNVFWCQFELPANRESFIIKSVEKSP